MKQFVRDLSKREIFFITIIVILIAGSGVFAWRITQRNKNQQSINSFEECAAAGNPIMESFPEQCAANGKTFTNTAQVVPDLNADNQDSANVFKIPELGVQFLLPTQLSGLYYVVQGDKPNIAYFSLEEFKNTDCAADKTSLAALTKLTEAEVEADEAYMNNKDLLKQINGYYYLAAGAQAACSEDAATQAKASAARSDILETIKNTLAAIE